MQNEYFDRIKKVIEENSWIGEFLLAQGYCVICGHDDPLDLEFHHVGRERNHPAFVVSVCRNCHGRFTRKQRWWSEKSLSKNNPPDLKQAYLFDGIGDVCKEKARRIFEQYGIEWWA